MDWDGCWGDWKAIPNGVRGVSAGWRRGAESGCAGHVGRAGRVDVVLDAVMDGRQGQVKSTGSGNTD
jgi:hypothetical protein